MKKTFLGVLSPLVFTLAVLGFQHPTDALDIFSDSGDGFLEVRPETPNSPTVHPSFDGSGGEGFFVNAGEWFGGITSGILPFQLPNFGAVNDPFASVDLGVHVFETGNAQATDIDLYALPRISATPTLVASEYYSGVTIDPSATLIQEGFLTPASQAATPAAPNHFTDATGDANLLSFLNTAYASGANAGSFVFLRLSYASDTLPAGFDAFKITSRNAGGGEGDYPILSVTTNTIPGDTDNDSIVEFEDDFNPIRDNWRETNDSFGMVLARADGDLNLDGMVGIEDFREWKDAFLMTGGSSATVSAAFASLGVPEPASVVVALLGFVCLSGYRPRRR